MRIHDADKTLKAAQLVMIMLSSFVVDLLVYYSQATRLFFRVLCFHLVGLIVLLQLPKLIAAHHSPNRSLHCLAEAFLSTRSASPETKPGNGDNNPDQRKRPSFNKDLRISQNQSGMNGIFVN